MDIPKALENDMRLLRNLYDIAYGRDVILVQSCNHSSRMTRPSGIFSTTAVAFHSVAAHLDISPDLPGFHTFCSSLLVYCSLYQQYSCLFSSLLYKGTVLSLIKLSTMKLSCLTG